MSLGRYRLTRALACASVAVVLAAAGCDPKEDPAVAFAGPPFLILAKAEVQPSSPEEGTTMYVQARGGTYVGLTTYGGTHSYAGQSADVAESCAELPASEPFYVLVKPNNRECLVEARLYADCDPDDGGSAFEMCKRHDSYVESVIVPVASRVFNDVPDDTNDGGADAHDAARDAARDGATDAKVDGKVGDGPSSDAKVTDASADQGTP